MFDTVGKADMVRKRPLRRNGEPAIILFSLAILE